MTIMTGAEAIIQSLRVNGVDTVFGLPGGQLDFLFDAMYKQGDNIRLIHSRHEQGVAYMAYGYAKSTGKVGTYAVVPGPGLLNSTGALCTAWANFAPVRSPESDANRRDHRPSHPSRPRRPPPATRLGFR